MKLRATVNVDAFTNQLKDLEKKVRRRVARKAVTKGGQAYVAVAKAECPVRDTSAALKSAGVSINLGKSKQSKIGLRNLKAKKGVSSASYLEFSDKKGRHVQIKYKGGLLRKAQGYKTKQYRGIGVAICGTRSGFRQQIGVRSRAGSKRKETIRGKANTRKLAVAGEPIYADPSKYAHLVIGGKGRGALRTSGSRFHENGTKAADARTFETAKSELDAAIAEAK